MKGQNYKVQNLGYIFVTVFLILEMSSVAIAVNSAQQSLNDNGWWPLQVGIDVVINGFYSTLICLIYSSTSKLSLKISALINSGLSILLFLKGYEFYAIKIDWLAVNDGKKALTWFEQLIVSPLYNFYLYGIFAVGTLLCCLYVRRKLKSDK